MPDLQHLALLKRGVFTWNLWRQEHPEVLPDLNGVNMAWAHLSRIDLSGAKLHGTNLRKASLDETALTDGQEGRDGKG